MLVKCVPNGSAMSLLKLDGSNSFIESKGNPIKWFYPDQIKRYAEEHGLILCELKTVYHGLSVMRGSDRHWYVVDSTNQQVMTYNTFKKEETAKELIDWHREAI